jgi:von Willebrand factor type A domain/Aerotolerance regulator N-terminal
MNWWPSFSEPKTAAIAAAVALPALLLLYFLKLRRKEMPIASTLLWKKSVQDLQVNAPFQKLRRNLLLLLQALLLGALLLALARPVSNMRPTPAESTLILIDRSASMQAQDKPGTTRLDVAKEQALGLIDSLPRGGRAMIIGFDTSAEVVQQFTSDRQLLRQAVNGVTPTDRSTRMKLAYQLAEASMGINPEQLRAGEASASDVHVFSDGRAVDADDLTIQANVVFNKIGDAATRNIGVVALSARRRYEKPNEVQVFARLANFGPEPATTTLQLSLATIDSSAGGSDSFEVRQVKDAPTLMPARWTEKERREAEAAGMISRDAVEFTLDLPTAAVIRVQQMAAEPDALAADDIAQVVIPPPRALSVALVSEGNPFVERLVASLGLDKPQTLTPSDYETRVKSAESLTYDLILFDRHRPSVLPAVGNFVFIGCVAPDGGLKPRVNPDNTPMFKQDVTVLDWDRDHPLVRGLNLRRIFVAETMLLDVPAEAEIIVDGDSAPLVVLNRVGRSTRLTIPFDVVQSNWPLLETFPYFFFNTLQYMALGGDTDVREGYAPGATPRLPRVSLMQGGLERGDLKLIGPKGTRSIAIPATGDFVLPPLDHVGLYRTEPAIPQFERLAVNLLDADESDINPSQIPPGKVGTMAATTETKRPVEWWWWIVACAAIPLLMIEWWVYTRRVHA